MRDPDNRKTAQRCAIATPLQGHESGTFNQCRQHLVLNRRPHLLQNGGFCADLGPNAA
jgi:hypothetical protein